MKVLTIILLVSMCGSASALAATGGELGYKAIIAYTDNAYYRTTVYQSPPNPLVGDTISLFLDSQTSSGGQISRLVINGETISPGTWVSATKSAARENDVTIQIDGTRPTGAIDVNHKITIAAAETAAFASDAASTTANSQTYERRAQQAGDPTTDASSLVRNPVEYAGQLGLNAPFAGTALSPAASFMPGSGPNPISSWFDLSTLFGGRTSSATVLAALLALIVGGPYVARRIDDYGSRRSDNPTSVTAAAEGQPQSQEIAGVVGQAADALTRFGVEIVNYAKNWLGVPYVLGGDGTYSTDCSQLTLDVYGAAGIDLVARDADVQKQLCMAAGGFFTDPTYLQPGDLVFYDNTYGDWPAGTATHVGIYAGNGMVLHASSAYGEVVLVPIEYTATACLSGFGSLASLVRSQA